MSVWSWFNGRMKFIIIMIALKNSRPIVIQITKSAKIRLNFIFTSVLLFWKPAFLAELVALAFSLLLHVLPIPALFFWLYCFRFFLPYVIFDVVDTYINDILPKRMRSTTAGPFEQPLFILASLRALDLSSCRLGCSILAHRARKKPTSVTATDNLLKLGGGEWTCFFAPQIIVYFL